MVDKAAKDIWAEFAGHLNVDIPEVVKQAALAGVKIASLADAKVIPLGLVKQADRLFVEGVVKTASVSKLFNATFDAETGDLLGIQTLPAPTRKAE